MPGSPDTPVEEMVARCEKLDLVANVIKYGVNGSYRTYPIKVLSLNDGMCILLCESLCLAETHRPRWKLHTPAAKRRLMNNNCA
jgi:hypothetical protein